DDRSGAALAAPARGEGSAVGVRAPGARPALRVVVVIPALNEQETIGRVVSDIPRALPGVESVEVLVVDDGSDDLTADRAWAAGVDHVARHPGNRGLAAVLIAARPRLSRGA